MLALVILFQYLEGFMKFGFGYVNFNFSLAFILATLVVAGYPFAFMLLALRFILGPLLSGNGYVPTSVIGQIVLLTAGVIVISLYFLWTKLIEKRFIKWTANSAFFQKKYVIDITGMIFTLLIATQVITFLNAVLFTPWFYAVFSGTWNAPLSLQETAQTYDYIRQFYFYIPSYWGGIYAVYTAFNTVNLAITFIIFQALTRVTKQLISTM